MQLNRGKHKKSLLSLRLNGGQGPYSTKAIAYPQLMAAKTRSCCLPQWSMDAWQQWQTFKTFTKATQKEYSK